VWSSHVAVEDTDSICKSCKDAINSARSFLKDNDTNVEVLNDLKMVCDTIPVPALPLICKKVVEANIPEVMKLLASTMDSDTICSVCLFCNNVEYDKALEASSAPASIGVHLVSVDSAVQLNSQPVSEKPTCPFCLMALQEVSDLIKSNKTKESIETALSKLCSRLSDKLIGQCTEFVKDYTKEVVDMLLADFTPQDACTFIKLCSDNATHYKNAKIVGIDGDFDDSEDKEVVSNPQCELCKNIVIIVEQHVIDKNSKEEIRRALEKSCSILKKFSAKCKKFVDEYSDRIVDLIEKELEPEEICKNLLFCVTSDDADSQDYDSGLEVFSLAMNEPAQEIEEKCVICEFIMTKLEKEINDTKTDEKIKTAVRNVCSKMPKTISKTCNQFVDYYFDMIIALLKSMKPSIVCTEMKLCDSGVSSDLEMVKKLQEDVFTCAICKGVVKGLDSIVEDPKVDTKIVEIEENLCKTIPGEYKEKVRGEIEMRS
jgi:saposin